MTNICANFYKIRFVLFEFRVLNYNERYEQTYRRTRVIAVPPRPGSAEINIYG